jgi:hypothetical protein
MVQLKLQKDGGIELTDRKYTVTLAGREIKLDNDVITSPGEYESGGVEVIYGTSAALLVWEHLQLAYVFSDEKPSSFDKAQLSSADVVIISSSINRLQKDAINNCLDIFNPSIFIATKQTEMEEGVQGSLKFEDTAAVKLSSQTIPTEGREFYYVS